MNKFLLTEMLFAIADQIKIEISNDVLNPEQKIKMRDFLILIQNSLIFVKENNV
jgi:hypothetical protein